MLGIAVALVRAGGAKRLQLFVELGEGARQLLLPGCVRCRRELTAELGVCEPQRFGLPHPFWIVIGFLIRASRALFLAFVHALLNAVLRVD